MLHVPDGRVLTDDWSLLIWAIIRSTLLQSGGGGANSFYGPKGILVFFSRRGGNHFVRTFRKKIKSKKELSITINLLSCEENCLV